MIVIEGVAALWWGAAVGLFCLTIVGTLLQPVVQRRRATRRDQPPVSLLLPIKMLDAGFDRALVSTFDQRYPQIEIFVAAAETSSPAIDRAKTLLADRGRFVAADGPRRAASPKLDVLAAPLLQARHGLIMTKDSNITFAPDSVAAFVENLADDVGLVCAVPVAVRAENLCGRVEAMLINGHARLLLLASTLGIGFGVGKVTLFRADDLRRAGGLPALAHTIAEDSALAAAMRGLGLKTVFAHKTVDQEIGARTWGEIYQRQVRWAVIRRRQEPVSFPLEPLSSPLPAAIAGALAAPLVGLAPLALACGTFAVWCGLEIAVTAAKGWSVHPTMPLAFCGREILALSSWLRAWIRMDVVWANERYDVGTEREAPPSN